jgi:hypothetical protein
MRIHIKLIEPDIQFQYEKEIMRKSRGFYK